MLKIYALLVLSTMALSGNAFAQNKRKNTTTKTVSTSTSPVVITQTPTSTTISSGVGAEKKTEPIVSSEKIVNPDLIYQTNGFIIQAKISEVSPTEIIYKKWNNLDGPTFRISRNDVKKVKYSNGEEDNNIQTFSSQNAVNQSTTVTDNSGYVSTNSSSSQSPKPVHTGFNQKRFGVRGGVNGYKLSASSGTSSGKTSSGTGFNVGFVGDFPIKNNISIRVAPMVSFKNTILSNGNTLGVTSIDATIDALYHIPSSQGDFVIGGGLGLGYFLSGDSNGTAVNFGNNPKSDNILPLDFGINITGGYDARAWSLNAFYTFGLANLNPTYGNGGSNGSTSLGSSTVGLCLTYWFGGN